MLMFICSVVFIILDVEDMEEQNNADKANLDGSDHDGLQISQNWICKKKKKKKNDKVEEDGDKNIAILTKHERLRIRIVILT